MTALQVKLHQRWANGCLEAAAVAKVRLVGEIDGRVSRQWWSMEKPVNIAGGDGQAGTFTAFELPRGGRYSVGITLPRGTESTTEYLVGEGETRQELISLGESPHEYLGWQQYAGVVRAKLSMSQERRLTEEPDPVVRAAHVPSSIEAWRMKASRGPLMDWMPRSDQEFVTWFRPQPEGEASWRLVEQLKARDVPQPANTPFPRWLVFESQAGADLVSAPWAWWGTEPLAAEELHFLYRRTRPNPVGRLTASVQDRRWFGLLEFLASGQLEQSAQLVQGAFDESVAQDALYGKLNGPLVAVAGAIVLTSIIGGKDRERWDQWVANLSNWFPGIPDGAILLGCRQLRRAGSRKEVDAAFAHLDEGVRRGIPFFAATVRMMTLALAQMEEDVPEAGVLRRLTAGVSSRIDPDQPFTVIRL